MAKHRLVRKLPNGKRWSEPTSGVVLFTPFGELWNAAGFQVGHVHRWLQTGEFWDEVDY